MSELDDIARERYETGAYGSAHLRMAELGWTALRTATPAPASPSFGFGTEDVLARMMSIPIRIDDSVPVGEWQLVDNATGNVIRLGRIDG